MDGRNRFLMEKPPDWHELILCDYILLYHLFKKKFKLMRLC